MSIADEIGKLNELKQSGAMSEQEYQQAKETLLAKMKPAGAGFKQTLDGLASDANTWGMLIHLSQFCGYVVPFAGMVVPLVLWQLKNKDSEVIDQHGRAVMNWVITEILLGILFIPLCFVLIGIPLLMVLAIVGVIFPIIGAVKANKGEVWPYPGTIKFIKQQKVEGLE